MKKKIKHIPVFHTEEEEHKFWAEHSPLDFMDTSSVRRGAFPNLKPSLKSVSIRLPEDMLDDLKIPAHKKDVPYQSLAKMYLTRIRIQAPQHFLYFLPLPQGQGSFRPTLGLSLF